MDKILKIKELIGSLHSVKDVELIKKYCESFIEVYKDQPGYGGAE